ncbi:MAG: cytochrome c1 [Steroidobacteraceae bacterium]|jgi:ubiquinol-cytochrome c reductase cytochrome c1 subunit
MHKHIALPAVLLAAWILPAGMALAEEGESYQHAGTDITDTESLQRGARNFMNYCSGCHSLKYLRYNRLGEDLKIPAAEVAASLMFTSEKPFDGINSAMPADSATWFGKRPPDLSLTARAKGVDYIYSFLKGFYLDKSAPWGVNNMVLPNASMPFVLQSQQGLQKPVFKNETVDGEAKVVLTGVEPLLPGSLKPEEYDQFVRDIANFLDYAGEPIKAKRQSLGIYVIAFLLVFLVIAYLLKKEYWKDVH